MKAPDQHIYLTALFASLLVVDCMDELEQTPYFKQRLKQTGKPFTRELERVIKVDVPLVWGLDDKKMYMLMEYQSAFIRKLAAMRPEEAGVINEIINRYTESPEQVLQALGLQLVDVVPEVTEGA